MTAATVMAPSTGLEWRQWARGQIEALGLPSPEAHLLTVLADRATAGGAVELGVPLMARQLGGLSESQVHRRLGALVRRGLLRTRQRGRGRIALRELVAVPVPVQLALFDDTSAPAAPAAPAPVEAPVAPWAASARAACSRTDASKPSHQREAAVEGQFVEEETRAARAATPENDPKNALAPRLDEVLAILEPAIGPIIEPLAFNSALAAFPEARGHDHVQAAHIVASYGFDTSGARSPISLLRQVLRNQLQGARRSGARHGGRRRPAPPASPAMMEQTERQTETMWRLAKAAGFGGQR